LIKDQKIEVEQPMYLVPSSVQFPDTAVEAVRKETHRVYDNARDIIISGLGMPKALVLSESDLEKPLNAQNKVNWINIDELYVRRVKSLFSAIIAFISDASFTWKEQQSGSLHWLRDANGSIVEAVKACKHLQKNMLRYLLSDNYQIRREYNQLRIRVALLLRQLEQIRGDDQDDNSLLSLDEIRLSLLEWDKKQNLRYYQLIREGKITPEMGSSLINDANYVDNIHNSLLARASTLFSQATARQRSSVERELSLDDAELDEILGAAEQSREQQQARRAQ
jgi:phosphate:Na+ symporter